MKLLATAILALILHLLLGWAWTILAGVIGGLWKGRGGWWVGGLGVGLSWLWLILFNFGAAAEPIRRMTDMLGGILGGMILGYNDRRRENVTDRILAFSLAAVTGFFLVRAVAQGLVLIFL